MNDKKTVLVVDGGGRGSVLVEAYLKSNRVKKVLAVPGNDLMTLDKNVKIFPNIRTTDIQEIIRICKAEKVGLVDVAQDDAVAVGLVDEIQKEGTKAFGPKKSAGRIEWDKAWARNLIKKFKIPIPRYKICKTQKEGISYIKKQKNGKWFVKASGLAAGKGALYARNKKDAIAKIKQMKQFGKAGSTYLIEECLKGEEFSSFAIVNGKKFAVVGHAQDHKTVFDGDRGPNTGGMGCSSPPLAITPEIEKQINSIFQKTVNGLAKVSRPYVGILYLGGMIVKEKRLARRSPERSRTGEGRVYVIEFNSRWGDPEAQVIIPAIKNDYYKLILDASHGKLQKIKKDKKYRVVVTAASKGYPKDYKKVVGKEIKGIASILRHHKLSERSVKVFGAGVLKKGKKFIVNGGRLFYVLGDGKNIEDARKKTYDALLFVSITGNNLHYRKDIGYRDLKRIINKYDPRN